MRAQRSLVGRRIVLWALLVGLSAGCGGPQVPEKGATDPSALEDGEGAARDFEGGDAGEADEPVGGAEVSGEASTAPVEGDPQAQAASPGASDEERPDAERPDEEHPEEVALVDGAGVEEMALQGLPAVSVDGRWVVWDSGQADGARGNPNLAFTVIDVSSGKQTRTVIFDPDEYEQIAFAGGSPLVPPLAERVKAARAALEAHAWRPLSPMQDDGEESFDPMSAEPPYEHTLVAEGGLVRVTFKEPRLTITRAERVLHDKRHKAWSAKKTGPLYPGCDPRQELCFCENPAYLGQGWFDAEAGVILLEIDYVGTDMCWEPESHFAAFRLDK